MKTRLLSIILTASTLTYADTLILKNGQHIEGTYLGGDARSVKFDAADHISTYQVADVEDVHFGSTAATSTTAATPQQQQRTVQIYANTPITVRLIDAVKSDDAAPGALYQASIDQPVYWSGRLTIPAHSAAVVQLLDKTDSGRLTGKATLSLALTKIDINGTLYNVQTTDNVQASGNRAGASAKITGGTAAAGALLGALAAGGRGAAIGAGSGAAAGAAVSALRPGQKLNFSPETKLTFRLASPLSLPVQ
jgi:hypothetical protein